MGLVANPGLDVPERPDAVPSGEALVWAAVLGLSCTAGFRAVRLTWSRLTEQPDREAARLRALIGR